MPRYFFARNDEPPETEGEELPDDEAALQVAKAVALELGKGRESLRITVYRANGEMVEPRAGLVIDFKVIRRGTGSG